MRYFSSQKYKNIAFIFEIFFFSNKIICDELNINNVSNRMENVLGLSVTSIFVIWQKCLTVHADKYFSYKRRIYARQFISQTIVSLITF